MARCDPQKDCLKIPIPPKCFDFCVEKILSVATPEDKVKVLGMDKDLAHNIFHAYNSGRRIRSFRDLERKLSPTQIKRIRVVFLNLNQKQLNYFTPYFTPRLR